MVALGGPARTGFAPVASNVDFATDNRFDTVRPSVVVKLDGTEQITVIGKGQSGHLQLRRTLYHILNPIGPVEQTEIAV
jgi:hypothetical protein